MSSSKRVLFLTNHPVQDGSNRYRVYQFIPAFEAAGFRCTVAPFTTPGLFRKIRRGKVGLSGALEFAYCCIRRFAFLFKVNQFDILVIHREAFPFFMPFVERLFLWRHPIAVFSFDDAIFEVPAGARRWKGLLPAKYGKAVDTVIERSAHVIVGNTYLGDYASKLNENITVIPTVVDLQRYQPAPRPEKEIVTIGWYGSDTTSRYLRQIAEPLQRLQRTFGEKVAFRFFGDPSLRLDLRNAEYLPFQLETEIDDLNSLDIGIMPMPDDPWTRGKCSFKAIQYMALEIPPVVSPVGTARDVVQNGVTGLWASTPDEWYNALSCLVADESLRKHMGVRARQSVAANYSCEHWVRPQVEIFERISQSKSVAHSGATCA